MTVGSELSSSRSRLYSVDLTGELSHLRRLLGKQVNQLELEVETYIPSQAPKTARKSCHDWLWICSDWLERKEPITSKKNPGNREKRGKSHVRDSTRECCSFSSAMTGKQK